MPPKNTAKAKKQRAASVDNCRSIRSTSTVSSRAGSDLLQSDDEEAVKKIEMMSTQAENATNGERKELVSAAVNSSTNVSKQRQKPKTDENDSIMSLLRDIKKNQFTKKDSTSLKKSFDDKFAVVQTELNAHSSQFVDIEERLSRFENNIASASYNRELQKQ
ncbi:uncharacterized protein LOC129571454 [Sitodiplosis mosellana]|uniref:uncharacterized protein LOC129571454 n=1 Tax=Sitodiplosis mosellana TaxID=263140 RepID=UPI00244468E2|nr:uncharacterized protein LOC129571454 [Sitodiplosis mosellana]